MQDFKDRIDGFGINGTVLVQSQESVEDTLWLLTIAAADPIVAGVVGWCDLHAPKATATIGELGSHPKLVGLRPMVQDRPADWFDDPAIDEALDAMAAMGLRLDALVRVHHLGSLYRLGRRRPELRVVIDHAAKPRVAHQHGYANWYAAISPLASLPNVYCKLSGLLTECEDRSRSAIDAYVDALLEMFGSDRLMWGSDWPVLESAATYHEWVEIALGLVPEAARATVFGDTALTFYGLAETRGSA